MASAAAGGELVARDRVGRVLEGRRPAVRETSEGHQRVTDKPEARGEDALRDGTAGWVVHT
jgi:hypothetical protein